MLARFFCDRVDGGDQTTALLTATFCGGTSWGYRLNARALSYQDQMLTDLSRSPSAPPFTRPHASIAVQRCPLLLSRFRLVNQQVALYIVYGCRRPFKLFLG
jgi:hypothetical protein